MKRLIFLAFVFIAFASSTADAKTNKPAPASADDAASKEIRSWLEQWKKSFSTKDADAVMALVCG
jgi:hypothetical protein